MAKFYGNITFSITEPRSDRPSIYEEHPTDVLYYGEIHSNRRRYYTNNKTNDDIEITQELSILSDDFAIKHCSEIKAVEIEGVKWKVESIDIRYPRLILSIGGVYNG